MMKTTTLIALTACLSMNCFAPAQATVAENTGAAAMETHGELIAGEDGTAISHYTLEVAADTHWRIDLDAEFDTYLFVQLPNGEILRNDDRGSGDYNSSLNIHTEEAGTLTIGVSSFGFTSTGEFTLAVNEITLSPNTPTEAEPESSPFADYLQGGEGGAAGDGGENIYGYPLELFFGETAEFRELEGQQAPAIDFTDADWLGDAITQEDLDGRVVIIDFWATWCGPCVASIPHNQEIQDTYGDDVVFLGACVSGEAEQMHTLLSDRNASYAACYLNRDHVDDWVINFFPTYYVIDREGVVRAAGLAPGALEQVVESILSEDEDTEAPADADTVATDE